MASIMPSRVFVRLSLLSRLTHQVQGAGGTLGPSLDNVISEKGKAFFLRKVKEPQFNNSSSSMPQMPITDEELTALAEFLSPK